jgi:prepilin-type N-terminal cleavage/methylation domain-containing protein
MHRRAAGGFTLVEVLVTLTVIASLAAVVVPTYAREARKVRASSEVHPVLADLRTRIETYAQEHNAYPTSVGESTWHPAVAPGSLYPLPGAWLALKFRSSGPDVVACSYTWVTGAAADRTNVGIVATSLGFSVPNAGWWYVVARCDLDRDGQFAWFLTSSVDVGITARDEGE